jgi:hypothetical protein
MRVLCVEEMKMVAGGYSSADNSLLPPFMKKPATGFTDNKDNNTPSKDNVVPNQEIVGGTFEGAGENIDYVLDNPGKVIGKLIDAALDSAKGGTSGAYVTGKIGDPSTGGGVTPKKGN